MRIDHSFFTGIRRASLTAVLALIMLSGCNTREDKLSAREALVSARESELVTLFAELVEQRKALESSQSDKLSNTKENQDSSQVNVCSNDANSTDAFQKEQSVKKVDAKTILGGIENVFLDPPGMEFSARIDTGAQTSSLNALDIVEFERDGKPFVKFSILHPHTGEKLELTRRLRHYVRIKERGGRESQRRPVVRMRVMLADIDEQINFTLEDRSRFSHQVLIGRNLLQDLAIVDISRKYTTVKTDNPETGDIK